MRTLAIAAAMYLFDWPWAERLGEIRLLVKS
jgi:hypothetical protein